MNYRKIITIEPEKRGGKPCARGSIHVSRDSALLSPYPYYVPMAQTVVI